MPFEFAGPAVVGAMSGTLVIAGLLGFVIAVMGLVWRRHSHAVGEASKLRATLDAVEAAIVVADEDLTVLDANAAAVRLLDLKRRGNRRGLFDRLSSDEVIEAETREALQRAGRHVFEASIEDGAKRHVRVRLHTMDVGGRSRIAAVLDDISAERELAQHYEGFLDHLIENAPVEISILSPDGRYRYLSTSFLVDERQRSWLIGKTDFDYCRESGLHPEMALRRRAHRLEAIDRKEAVFFEEDIAFEGDSRRISWRYVPYVDPATGDVLMVLGFGVDETKFVRCRDELEASREESAKALRLKEALLQNVSHEIRTPLSSIIGTAQMLRTEVDPALRDFIENVEDNGRRLSETLNNMLDLAGLQADHVDLRPRLMDVAEEVRNVVRAARPSAERRGLFLEVNAAESELLIRTDPDAFARCIRSLIDNALKFTTEGGVVVDVSGQEKSVYVRVMDTGVGIGRSRHSDVFEAFLQEDEGIDRSFEGAGVGLAVTERLVRHMGGEIRVHSRKGAGSSFVVCLPLAMPAFKAVSRPHVLIADPQPESHRLIAHLLRDVFTVQSAHRVADLIDLGEDRKFHAVLVDARLDGDRPAVELRAALRAMHPTADARLVFIESDPRGGRRRDLLDDGWDEVVERPLTKLALLNALIVDPVQVR